MKHIQILVHFFVAAAASSLALRSCAGDIVTITTFTTITTVTTISTISTISGLWRHRHLRSH